MTFCCSCMTRSSLRSSEPYAPFWKNSFVSKRRPACSQAWYGPGPYGHLLDDEAATTLLPNGLHQVLHSAARRRYDVCAIRHCNQRQDGLLCSDTSLRTPGGDLRTQIHFCSNTSLQSQRRTPGGDLRTRIHFCSDTSLQSKQRTPGGEFRNLIWVRLSSKKAVMAISKLHWLQPFPHSKSWCPQRCLIKASEGSTWKPLTGGSPACTASTPLDVLRCST